MKTLLHNLQGTITAREPGPGEAVTIRPDVAILIDEGRIAAIDDPGVLRNAHPDARLLDGRGGWALPGLVDPHTHPVFFRTRESEFRMRVQGKSYEEIAAAGGGIRNSARAFREASWDDIVERTYHRIRPFLSFGTTTIEAKSGYALDVAGELLSLRVLKKMQELLPITIVPTFLGAHEVPDDYQDNRDGYVDLVVNEMIPQVAEEQLAVFCDVFCEEHVFTVAQSERILMAALDHGLKPKVHADELAYTGGAELAGRVGAISAEHLVKTSPEGIAAMAAAGVVPVLLPGTTFFLQKSGYAPARAMLDAGLAVALSTDFNPGSCMTQNQQLIMTIAALYMGVTPQEAFRAVTVNSAKAIGLEDTAGVLAPGRAADIAVMAIPNLDYLPYHFGINHARLVIRHGEVVHDASL